MKSKPKTLFVFKKKNSLKNFVKNQEKKLEQLFENIDMETKPKTLSVFKKKKISSQNLIKNQRKSTGADIRDMASRSPILQFNSQENGGSKRALDIASV